MQFARSLNIVDSHTMGQPTRIVTGGLLPIPGDNMAAKKKYLEQEMDDLRTSLMHEPRGHDDMFGSVVVSPTKKEADLGVIFMDGGGYLNMCGHGTIGLATVAVNTGMVKAEEPYTNIVIESPAGLIKTRVKVENGKAKKVSLTNVPSFLYKEDISINLPDFGELKVDIAFGGSFFGLINADNHNLSINPNNSDKLLELGIQIRKILNNEIEIKHPEMNYINTVDLIEFYSDNTTNPEADKKNSVIFGEKQLDRSPCGTGTSAKLAALFAKNKIGLNEKFVYESILGTLFEGKIIDTTMVGDYEAVIPEITGSAYIIGFNNFVIDSEDPLKHGFCLA